MVEPVIDRSEHVPGNSGEAQTADLDSLADEELLRLYRAGRGAEVFTEMVRRHQPMVLRTCLRLVGNMPDAEDAAQSVFLVLAQRPEVVRQSLAGCLHSLARAAVSELCRSRRRRSEREELAARLHSMFARLSGRDRPMEQQELREELDAALAQLPDPLQQAVILRYLEGHSQQEAAERAGCTAVTMGWRCMKGLQRLRTILSRRGAVLAPAALVALLNSEAQAASALQLGRALTGAATETARLLASALVKRSLLAAALRKATLVAVLVVATAGLGAGLVFRPQAAPEASSNPASQPVPEPKPPTRAPALGLFDRSLDIGRPARAGAGRFSENTYLVQGGGAHIFGTADQFHFVFRKWTGDGEIIARVAFDPDQDARQVHAGVMFREHLTPDSRHLAVLITGSDSSVKYRTADNPASTCLNSLLDAPGKYWVRLVRRGNLFTASIRADGTQTWKVVKEMELVLNPSVYVGLAVTANDKDRLATTTFDHVTMHKGP